MSITQFITIVVTNFLGRISVTAKHNQFATMNDHAMSRARSRPLVSGDILGDFDLLPRG
jgi:heme O synthase-like polyprenyltransferase